MGCGVGPENPVPLGKAGDLVQGLGVWVGVVEHIFAGVVDVDFVGGDQRAQREGVVLEKIHGLTVVCGRGVQRKVDALDGGGDAQGLGPPGENPHDRGAPRGHSDKVKGWFGGGHILVHVVLPSTAACRSGFCEYAEIILDSTKF